MKKILTLLTLAAALALAGCSDGCTWCESSAERIARYNAQAAAYTAEAAARANRDAAAQAAAPRFATAGMVPPPPAPQPRAQSGLVEAGYRGGQHRGGPPAQHVNPCQHGGNWNPAERTCDGQPHAVWRDKPWADAVPYDNGPTDSGWIHPRGKCLSYPNC